MGCIRKRAGAQVALVAPALVEPIASASAACWQLYGAPDSGREPTRRRRRRRELSAGCCEHCQGRGFARPRCLPSMGKKWRDAGEMERGCSDREDSAESRRRSRSASRGRFAESWKRLSSKQGSTKRSGLPAQQTPVSWGESGPQRPSFPGARNLVHGAELAFLALEPGNLWSHLQGEKVLGGFKQGSPRDASPLLSQKRGLWMCLLSVEEWGKCWRGEGLAVRSL